MKAHQFNSVTNGVYSFACSSFHGEGWVTIGDCVAGQFRWLGVRVFVEVIRSDISVPRILCVRCSAVVAVVSCVGVVGGLAFVCNGFWRFVMLVSPMSVS